MMRAVRRLLDTLRAGAARKADARAEAHAEAERLRRRQRELVLRAEALGIRVDVQARRGGPHAGEGRR